ncbi:WYL domain-containing protein [Nocardiopsis sp. N85]|uniref:helix-turn-helix transcriptional regulator n=1 Tax=Nocardiopsis sp. N85 TaxID=3029400 RepID=UPI00237F4981|nr:WYL domain-containing protein [Nocardiopsis sp. N85]MDE3724914.1 WYL domain-containing protein [Nocardiopsis sp. N85]
MADVTGRILALLTTLQSGRSFTGEELAARLDISPRTLRRDVERLRGYGYPVSTRPGPGGHYRLVAGAAMPPLVFDDDEAVATLLGLAALAVGGDAEGGSVEEAATRAYGKVDQYLPARLRHRAARLRESLESTTVPGPATAARDLSTLADAVRRRRIVAFDYRGRTGEVSSRRVEPHRQIHHRRRWYLLAWDVDKEDWRLFRTDRVADLRVTHGVHGPRPLPADTAADYLRRGLDRDRTRVVLTVDAPSAAVADAFAEHDAEFEALDDARTRVAVMTDTWEWLLPPLAFLAAGVTVHEPDAIRDALRGFGAHLRGGDAMVR